MMKTDWLQIIFTPEQLQSGKNTKLEDDFRAIFENLEFIEGIFLIARLDHRTYYISPKAEQYCASILREYKANHSPDPPQTGIIIAYGDLSEWKAWTQQ